MDAIAEIRALAEEYAMCGGNERSDGTKFELFAPPATVEQVRAFEQEMHITLPNDFVRYLTELGNGGIGPDYGIWSLDKMRENNPYAPKSGDLPPMIGGGLSEKAWKAFAHEAEAAEDEETFEQRLVAGGIFISTPGCTMDTLLMCKGAAAGGVVTIDFDFLSYYDKPMERSFSFADWMIEGLHDKIAYRKNGIYINQVTRYNENGLGMAGEKLTDLLIELRIAQLIEEGDADAAVLAPEIRAFYERAFGNGTFRMWIAISGRNVIGTVGLTLTEKPPYSANPTGKIGVLSSMYVAPEFRRRGIAKCLLGYVMRWARRNGIGTIHITASEQGMKLYESCGFTHNERFMKYDP
ncbi:GNAT family N-acetyltransferase [Ruminococcus albus]|uniref:GNAT family N-acetyltransferase n=1 Tax=Ruminococcus albus TaxID=1264 RepID=UPI000464424D|nr:GNAT family N-acetyltransferase [Ruminococcus albus]